MDWTTIIVAAISFLGTLAGSYSGFKLTAYRVQKLEEKVEEHNGFARRMPVVEERVKELFHQVDDVKHRMD